MIVSTTQTSSAAAAASATPAASGFGSMGGDQFMQLLLAQMKNQNPLDPVQDKDFMAQITQVNSLMEMEKVSANMQALTLSSQMIQAAGMIGKNVSYATPDGQMHSGLVSAVSFQGTQINLTVAGQQVPLKSITGVQLNAGVQPAVHG